MRTVTIPNIMMEKPKISTLRTCAEYVHCLNACVEMMMEFSIEFMQDKRYRLPSLGLKVK